MQQSQYYTTHSVFPTQKSFLVIITWAHGSQKEVAREKNLEERTLNTEASRQAGNKHGEVELSDHQPVRPSGELEQRPRRGHARPRGALRVGLDQHVQERRHDAELGQEALRPLVGPRQPRDLPRGVSPLLRRRAEAEPPHRGPHRRGVVDRCCPHPHHHQ